MSELLSCIHLTSQALLNLQAIQILPETMKPKALARMLQDWVDDCHGQILASGVTEYAEKIHEVGHGHAGLTGACCQGLKLETEASLKKQEQYLATKT